VQQVQQEPQALKVPQVQLVHKESKAMSVLQALQAQLEPQVLRVQQEQLVHKESKVTQGLQAQAAQQVRAAQAAQQARAAQLVLQEPRVHKAGTIQSLTTLTAGQTLLASLAT
jgi:hypothetical protein